MSGKIEVNIYDMKLPAFSDSLPEMYDIGEAAFHKREAREYTDIEWSVFCNRYNGHILDRIRWTEPPEKVAWQYLHQLSMTNINIIRNSFNPLYLPRKREFIKRFSDIRKLYKEALDEIGK